MMQPGFGGTGDGFADLKRQVERLWALQSSQRDADGNLISGGAGGGSGGGGSTPLPEHEHNGTSQGGVLIKPLFFEGAAPATPPANHVVIYAKADGNLYQKDDAGTETNLASGGGGGSVATDAIWDAVGDVLVGTGANTGARLAITVPAANIINVLGVVNGETTFSWKSLMDATVASTQAMGDAAAAGTGVLLARITHKHAMPALGTTAAAIGTSAGGSAVTPSKSDHVHATGAGTPSTQAFGDVAATGSGPAASMTDHKHAMPADSVTGHVAAGDPHTGYRLESADHSHASTGIQGGTLPLYQLVTKTKTLPLTAAGIMPTFTAGCASPQRVEYGTNDVDRWFADFDSTTKEYGYWSVVLPDWDLGDISYKVYWVAGAASTSTNSVVFGLQALATGNAEAMDAAYGTAREVTMANTATPNLLNITGVPATLVTAAGTPAAGDLVNFRLYRDPGNGSDTLAVDARVMMVVLTYGGA